jgi:HlyD family secretion protein
MPQLHDHVKAHPAPTPRELAMTTRLAPTVWLPLLFAAGCARPADKPTDAAAAGPPTVTLGKPEKQALKRTVEQPGQVEAIERTDLFARVPGYVGKLNVDIGDAVKAGDVLAELAVPELDQELKQKAALTRQAMAEVRLAQQSAVAAAAAERSAAALVEEAKSGRARAAANADRWRSEARRIEVMAGQRVIDQQTRDETQNQLKAAEAALAEVEAHVRSAEAARDEAAAKREKAQADVAVAEAKRDVAAADEQRTRELVGFARITAPFAGVVVRRNVDTGAFVQPGAAADKALFTVMKLNPLRVFIDVPEADAGFVRVGTPAKIRVPAQKAEISAAVTRTAGALDVKSRTLRTAIDLQDPPKALLPGLFVTAALTVEQPAAWTLPSAAVVRRGEVTYAFRVAGGKAVRLAVRTGYNSGARVEVFQILPATGSPQDVTGEEEFVVSDVSALADGQAVVVK